MATIGTVTGSKFIGTPMVIPVTPAFVSGATFQRVRLAVKVNGAYDFEFSTPAVFIGNTPQASKFDISSALRAVADQFEFTEVPNPIGNANYPSYSYTATAYDDYLINGVAQTGPSSDTTSQSGLYIGSLSDRERLAGTLSPSQFSRKPTSSPEIVFVGMTWLKGATGNSPSVRQVAITDQTAATSEYYPIAAPRDAYEIRFINSMGVHESVHVTCLPADETTIATTRYAISKPETVSDFSRGIAIKQNDRERWKMSTHPLDRQWQQWYLHEFLMAKLAWAKVDGLWLPVHILPDDTVKGRDRQKAAPMTVEFTIEFDINGSPFA